MVKTGYCLAGWSKKKEADQETIGYTEQLPTARAYNGLNGKEGVAEKKNNSAQQILPE